jgi:two-component system LytT family response regulator
MKKRISICTKNSFYLVDPEDIVYCKSNNSRTTLFLKGAYQIIISKGMSAVEKLLEGSSFIRTHQTYLVNRNHIVQVDKTHDYCLILSNQEEIPISIRRRKEILEIIKVGV